MKSQDKSLDNKELYREQNAINYNTYLRPDNTNRMYLGKELQTNGIYVNTFTLGDSLHTIEERKTRSREVIARETRARRNESASVQSIIETIKRYFPEEPEIAVAVARAESGLNPLADNGKCIGIFQIMLFPNRPSREELYKPEVNIPLARKFYDACKKRTGNGWKCDWEAYNNGAYLKYL